LPDLEIFMLVKILVILVAAYISFEILEHLIMPLIGKIFWKGRRQFTGREGMPGKRGRVREWSGKEGKVEVQSVIWNAVSDVSLSAGDPIVVEEITGLTLKVKPDREPS